MDNKRYLDKVLDQIMSETNIDYDKKKVYISSIYTPYYSILIPPLFFRHCKNLYGLTEDEIKYIWEEFRDIVSLALMEYLT